MTPDTKAIRAGSSAISPATARAVCAPASGWKRRGLRARSCVSRILSRPLGSSGPGIPDGCIAAEKVEKDSECGSAGCLEFRIAVQRQIYVVACDCQQLCVVREVGQAELRHTALAGDRKSVV